MEKISQSNIMSYSSFNENKAFAHFQLKINSAQNHEYLKLYDSSLNLYKRSKEINDHFNKTQIFNEEQDLQTFQLSMKKHFDMKINQMNLLSKLALKEKENESKIAKNPRPNYVKEKEERISGINELIAKSKIDLVELQNNNKSLNHSLMLESAIIGDKSFLVTQIKKNVNNNMPLEASQATIDYLDRLEFKYKELIRTLSKLQKYYNLENILNEEKEAKKVKLEQLKMQYADLKSCYEKACRNGAIQNKN